MTVQEAIEKADGLRPNDFSAAEKRFWLQQIEGRILREILSLYEEEETPVPVITGEEGETLKTGAPYDDVYVYGLCARYDFALGEIERYNMDAVLFDELWHALQSDCQRRYVPRERSRIGRRAKP